MLPLSDSGLDRCLLLFLSREAPEGCDEFSKLSRDQIHSKRKLCQLSKRVFLFRPILRLIRWSQAMLWQYPVLS